MRAGLAVIIQEKIKILIIKDIEKTIRFFQTGMKVAIP